MLLGFRKMTIERFCQRRRVGRLHHLRQRLHDVLLGVIDVLQRMQKKITQLFDFHCFLRS
jgi:hypothetical protein